jgi:hypothetical protein
VHLFHKSKNISFSIARDLCRLMVLFAMPMAVALLQCTDILVGDVQDLQVWF